MRSYVRPDQKRPALRHQDTATAIWRRPDDGDQGCGLVRCQAASHARPAVALAPGIAIALTVLALNVLGDGVRDALDPRAKLRVAR